ncbi:hypothetical protein GRF59_14865 [Paenibacillus sp. HJL G12]|uniref:DGQHR domain-containing protein n=1 Tax=Paenibacillus dendrobii TaxID=2691084 RepID=A0A7X3LGM0_9BACL|nr:DNA sulfur modification protein DndB [Paenibacillus dendrobii]MWV44901.1 hypothetical protein [Paenibacillus dendrobii]
MKRDREELEAQLRDVIDENKHSTKFAAKINNSLDQQGINLGFFNDVARGNNSLSDIDLNLLIVLSDAVYKVTEDKRIITQEYVSETELEKSKEKVRDNSVRKSLNLPLDLEEVVSIDHQTFLTKVSIKLLVEMFHAKLIVYDYETQRSAKYKMGKNGVVPVPDVNKKSVDDIAKNMLEQSYLPDMITINVYSNEVEPLSYDEKNKLLTINDGATVSILDGFHRLQGAVKALAINPDLDLELLLSIRSYDTDIAKKYFGQINTINVVKKQRLRELKSENWSDAVVRDLQQKSELKGNKIASAANISEIAGQLTTFDIMAYGIEKVFSPNNFLEYKEVANYLTEFFNYLTGNFNDEFINNPKPHRKSYINHPLMFLGYIQIAKNFKDTSTDTSEIKNLKKLVDFNDSKLIELLNNKSGINSNRVRNQVINYFRN